jgi:transcription antitermination factor NusG
MLELLRSADPVPAPRWTLERWHILLSEPCQERRASERLTDAGFLAYAPIIVREVRAARGRKREIASALFPSYLFVAMPIGREDWMGVRGVRGVRSFLQIDGQKAILKPKDVDDIRAAERAIEARRQRRLAKAVTAADGERYEVGQRVTVKIGPFAELLANVEGVDPRGRIQVLLDMAILGRRSWPVDLAHLSSDVNH